MKLRSSLTIILPLLLAASIGTVVLYFSIGFSKAIVINGAHYPPESKHFPITIPNVRDLSHQKSQIIQSEFSHLFEIFFSVPPDTQIALREGQEIEAICKLYELRDRPNLLKMRTTPKIKDAFPGAVVVAKKYVEMNASTKVKMLAGGALVDYDTPLAYIAGQTFTALNDELCAIDVLFSSYARECRGTLIFHLVRKKDTGKDIRTISVDASQVSDMELVSFEFEPLKNSRFASYGFFLTSEDMEPDSSPTVLITQTNLEVNGNAWINYKWKPLDLCFRARYCSATQMPILPPKKGVISQLIDIDLSEYEPIRMGQPHYLGLGEAGHIGLFQFPAVAGSAAKFYLFVVELNGTAVSCNQFSCKHSAGSLPATANHVAKTLMIDKPPGVKMKYIVWLACLLLFLLVIFVNWLGLPDKSAETGRAEHRDNHPPKGEPNGEPESSTIYDDQNNHS
ncbi:hypothetical protein J7M28_01835 [bacterium]|nr:hypothetical protein [bacterium]